MNHNEKILNDEANKSNDKLYSFEWTEGYIFYFYDEKEFEINIAEKYIVLEENHTNECNNNPWFCKYPIQQEENFGLCPIKN